MILINDELQAKLYKESIEPNLEEGNMLMFAHEMCIRDRPTGGQKIMKIRREEHMAGGNGHVIIKEILDAEQFNGKGGLYAQVTLEPGCSLGYHEHHGESETYYILHLLRQKIPDS